MRKFSFDAPSEVYPLNLSVGVGLVLQKTKILRFEDGHSVAMRDVRSLEFIPEIKNAFMKSKPTGMVEIVIRPIFSNENDPKYSVVMTPLEAQALYQKLFDEFFSHYCLDEVQSAAFPLKWSCDLEWQPFEVKVNRTVEKNW